MIGHEVGRGMVAERHAVTPDQVVAARKLLGWSRGRLEATSGASGGTVRTYERDGRLTRAVSGVSGAAQLAAIRTALEEAGVVFIEENGGGPGVWLQARDVTAHDAQAARARSAPVTPAQLQAARELLGWGVNKLAGRSGTTSNLVRTYERSGRLAANYGRTCLGDPLLAIRAALEEAGVEFTSGDAPGVRLKQPAP